MNATIGMVRWTRLARIARKYFKMPFYAVAKGRNPGIYNTWDECKTQVNGFTGAKFKKFQEKHQAQSFLGFGATKAASASSTNWEHVEKERIPFIDFWPEDVEGSAEDDIWLATEAAKIEAASVTSDRKRKASDSLKDVMKRLQKTSTIYPTTGVEKFGENSFPVDALGYVLAYTDGSCERNGMKNAVAGLGVYFSDNHPLNTSKPVSGLATNNAGEIQAACEAIRIAKRCGIQKLRINTDSQFLINSITTWIRSWKKNNWRLSSGAPIKNLTDFRTLDSLLNDGSLRVEWNYVKGHSNIKGNDRADELARRGAALYKLGSNA